MKTITAITAQKKNSKRCNIFIDDEFAFGLAANLVLDCQLRVGVPLDEETIQRLQTMDQFEAAKEKALRALNRRMRSTGQIRQLLQDFPVEIVNRVLDFLQEYNFVNDPEFARGLIADRLRFRPRGWPVLQQELRAKGVAPDIIKSIIAEYKNNTNEESMAMPMATKKWQADRALDLPNRKNRLYQYLTRRGFDYDLINQIIEQLTREI